MTGAQSATANPNLELWLAFSRVPGVGVRTRIELLEHFGSIEAVYGASGTELEHRLGGRSEAVRAILAGPDAKEFARERAWLAQPGHRLLTWADADYPPLLRQIHDPPSTLYVLGEPRLLMRPQLAIVGARNATPGGAESARAFAQTLAQAGLAITSGLALGIDAAAHRGALEAGGVTIAIAGTGLDRVYPARHRELAHAIAERGAIVSELALGTPPAKENFPVRNRLISGLSLGVLVVEAALQSGSLITARLAAEHGREVFAIPGSIHSPLARGCHALIRQGAKLVETAADVLEELGALARFVQQVPTAPEADARPSDLSASMRRLLDCLGFDPAGVDTLVERSGLTADAVSSMLLQLELQGFVTTCPGGKYQRMS